MSTMQQQFALDDALEDQFADALSRLGDALEKGRPAVTIDTLYARVVRAANARRVNEWMKIDQFLVAAAAGGEPYVRALLAGDGR